METQITTLYGLIKYERFAKFILEEGAFLSGAIKEAFKMLNVSFMKLKRGEVDESLSKSLFKDDSGLLSTLKELIDGFKNKSIKCVRARRYADSEGNEDASVLASVSEEGVIKIYDSFFNIKDMPGDRAGVIIHEAAHLAGLRGESNFNDDSAKLESAEAVKNFCLCANGKLSLAEIGREKEAAENPASEESTYRPDQARAPKGQSNGGQWISEGGSGNSSKNEDSKGALTYAKESGGAGNKSGERSVKKLEGKAPKGAISDTVRFEKINAKRAPTGEYVDFKDIFNIGSYIDENNVQKDGIWGAFNFMDGGYPPNTDVTLIARIEFEYKDGDSKIHKKSIDIAYDTKSDSDGVVKIDRLSIINKENESYRDMRDKMTSEEGAILGVKLQISSVEGKPKEIFGEDGIAKNKIDSNDIRYYAQQHASAEKESEYAQHEGADGGQIKEYEKMPPEKKKMEKRIFEDSVQLDLFSEKVM